MNAPQARKADTQMEGRIRDEYGLPAIDAVRLHLWSFFGTVEQFADRVGVPRHAFECWLADHGWELPTAPALDLQNKDLSGREPLCVSSGKIASVGRFVSRNGQRHLCWSRTQPSFEAPGWSASLRSLRDGRRLGEMRLKPDDVKLESESNRPEPASARSADAVARKPAVRQRQSDRLASVSFVDRLHGWAAGGLGTILHTADGGATWDEQDSGTEFILERVFFVDRNHGWAVGGWPRGAAVSVYGGMGVILATSDGGRHWSKQLDGEATWLKDVFFLNARQGWAVGEYGTVLKTTDGGGHWRPIQRTGTPSWLYGVAFVDERHGLAVGHDETILRTDDGGETWTVGPSPVPRRSNGWPAAYRAVAFAGQQRGWIVGDGGTILGTNDGGGSWQLEPLALPDTAAELASFEYLNAAREIEEVAVRTQHPFRGGWLHRLSVGHCYHAPAHVGRVHFMQDIVLNGQVAFHQLTGNPDVRQCLENASNGMLDEFTAQQDQGLPGWGYTSCPFMLRPGPIQHNTRVDARHSFGALTSYMALYYTGTISNDPEFLRKVHALLPRSGFPFDGKMPTQGKTFAQSTRWVPSTMYYVSHLRQSVP